MNKYRRARERAGFTQKELSALIGVEASVLSRYELDEESNRINPPEERKRAIAEYCGIPLDFLEEENPKWMETLSVEQKARFIEVVKNLEQIINRPLLYGNPHPFRYLLKPRWVPIVQDAFYIDLRFHDVLPTSNSTYILEGDLGGNPDISPEDRLEYERTAAKREVEEEYFSTLHSDLRSAGARLVYRSDGKYLDINVDNIDPDILHALLVLIRVSKKASQKGLEVKPVKPNSNLFDVWEQTYESEDGLSSGWLAKGMDMTANEAENFIDSYVPEKENPSKDPEGPETADSNIQK